MDNPAWNASVQPTMIDTPVPSPNRSGKVKPLRKLNLKKDQEHSIPACLSGLLNRNCLTVYPENKCYGIFEALSLSLFLKKDHAEHLKAVCTSFLKQRMQTQLIPPNLKALSTDSLIFAKYLLDPELYIFDPITFELVSYILELTITVYSGFKENRVLFANTINSGFVRKAEVASVSEDGHIRYASVFSHENIMLLKKFSEFNENGTSKDATDDDGWEYDVSPQQEAQLNEHILSVWLQKLGVVDSQVLLQQVFNDQIDARSDRATPNSATQMVSESSEAKTQGTEILALGLSSEIQKYLLTTQLMEHEIVKLTKNEDNLNSAQKQLAEIYHTYTKTVQVEQVTEKRKQSNNQILLSSALNTPNQQKNSNSTTKKVSGYGVFDFSTGKAPGQPQATVTTGPTTEAEKSNGSQNEEVSSKQKTHSESIGEATIIDEPSQVEIDMLSSSFANRVDDSVPPNHFVGKNPPGLSRPVMYINNTRVKKLLNESVLKTPKSINRLTSNFDNAGEPNGRQGSGTKQNSSHDEVEQELLGDSTPTKLYSNPNTAAVAESQHFLLDRIKEFKSIANPERKKPVILLKEDISQHRGRLKFYNEKERYGFVTLEETGQDIFVYEGELLRCGLEPSSFRTVANGKKLPVVFGIVDYIGKKGSKSRKAVDLKIVPEFSTS